MTAAAPSLPPPLVVVRLDIRTRNPLNGSQGRSRGAMLARAAERKRHRSAASWACFYQWRAVSPIGPWDGPGDVRVTLTRIAPRPLDSHDGLRAALKPVVDGVADFLGITDNSERVTWNYNQHRGRVREHAVLVTFERQP